MDDRTMQTRSIPGGGEALPVIGCGIYMGFDRSPGAEFWHGRLRAFAN